MTPLARYYDWLGRFQRVAGWMSRSGDQSLTVHRRLLPERPDVPPHAVVHERLLSALGSMADTAPRVIDAGCGLGGTTFFLHARLGGQYDSVTLSPSQRARAEREARRRGVSRACRFHLRSYDHDFDDLMPDGADLVVAIESLAHAPDPARTVRTWLDRCVQAGVWPWWTTCRASRWPTTIPTSRRFERVGAARVSRDTPCWRRRSRRRTWRSRQTKT